MLRPSFLGSNGSIESYDPCKAITPSTNFPLYSHIPRLSIGDDPLIQSYPLAESHV